MNDNNIIVGASSDIPVEYENWRKSLEKLIEESKYNAVMNVNAQLLTLYWSIGHDILEKQKELGWGAQVINRLSEDLTRRFPDDRGYSVRNLKNMRAFAKAYPNFPIVQVPLAQLENMPKLFADVASSLPQIDDLEIEMGNNSNDEMSGELEEND